MGGIDYLDSVLYIWSHLFCSRSVFTWLSSASESLQSWTIALKFLFWVMVVFKFLLFFNSSNVLVTLEIALTAFKMQPCIFWVFRSLDMVFDRSISLKISGLHFLIFKEFKFSGLQCFSNFLTSFFRINWVKHYIVYNTSQFFSILMGLFFPLH